MKKFLSAGFDKRLRWGRAATASFAATLLAACGVARNAGHDSLPPDESRGSHRASSSTSSSPSSGTTANTLPPLQRSGEAPHAQEPTARNPASSQAETPRAYRKDAATHLYGLNGQRIYKGKLPPMLYAVGVLDVDIDKYGRVGKLHWKRPPSHVPEVIEEIEQIVRSAAPYPVPARLGKVTYTDVWLWDESGKFQLDTLTEGQE